MKKEKKKLALEEIQLHSFVTQLEGSMQETVQGAGIEKFIRQ